MDGFEDHASAGSRGAAAGAVADGRLRLERVRITLRGKLLTEIDVAVAPGEVLTVMGPSGSGKSTLLNYVGGFLDDSFEGSGRVALDGRDVTDLPPERRRIALLFQNAALFPHLSVCGNVLFGAPKARTRSAAAMRRRAAEEALAEVGLEGFADRDPATLSGGQQARVALLRALFSEPRALLLDEPFSSLDADLRDDMRRLVARSIARAGLPAILVTHDPADAAALPGPRRTL